MQMNQTLTAGTAKESGKDERRCYTVEEVMKILGIGRKAAYSLIRRKEFPAICIRSVGYRIPKESFHVWMFQQEV